jgi:glyoxalase family protein
MSTSDPAVAVHGIHHVTAIAGDPQENYDFYTRVMGLRMVKKSVNQDAPDTYHLFFADGAGTPGTDLTFFPWPEMHAARRGVGQVVEVPFAIPSGSLGYWQERLLDFNVTTGEVETRFGETTLPVTDPHGFKLALVETDDARAFTPWDQSPVPAEHQVRGMHTVRLWERALSPTERVLTQVMGFEKIGEEDGWHRYGVERGTSGTLVDIQVRPETGQGRWGPGAVHHVAWRMRDGEEQMALREVVDEAGLQPTRQIDRFWFQSVYFKEPGGTLFELATDGPGFDRDEDPDKLGEKLILPPWLESRRASIEAALPPLEPTPAAEE